MGCVFSFGDLGTLEKLTSLAELLERRSTLLEATAVQSFSFALTQKTFSPLTLWLIVHFARNFGAPVSEFSTRPSRGRAFAST